MEFLSGHFSGLLEDVFANVVDKVCLLEVFGEEGLIPHEGTEEIRETLLDLLKEERKLAASGSHNGLDLEILRETTDRILTASDEEIVNLGQRIKNIGSPELEWERQAMGDSELAAGVVACGILLAVCYYMIFYGLP